MHTLNARRTSIVLALLTLVVSGAAARAQKPEKESKRPHLTLKAQPSMGSAPLHVTMVADLAGGPNDLEEFYCAKAIWDWGDGGSSEKSTDCDPYEKGKSEIRRKYTEEHVFRRSGYYRVYFALEKRDKEILTGWVNIAVQGGNPN